jgi:hypothetical protein
VLAFHSLRAVIYDESLRRPSSCNACKNVIQVHVYHREVCIVSCMSLRSRSDKKWLDVCIGGSQDTKRCTGWIRRAREMCNVLTRQCTMQAECQYAGQNQNLDSTSL